MMNAFPMEELIPIVAELAEKYTSGESSSVSYERARGLMGAVIYCINETSREKEENCLLRQGMTVRERYETGCRMVVEKAKRTTILYNELMQDFWDFGNENYRDTVTRAIPGFLKYYDPMFAPQETIITMDYPTILPISKSTGIDAVYEYVRCILWEQKFFHGFSEEYVCSVLERYHCGYQRHFFNLCGVFLRYVIWQLLMGKNEEQEERKKMVSNCGSEELEQMLKEILHQLIEKGNGEEEGFEEYLQYELKDFAYELSRGIKNKYLEKDIDCTVDKI